MEQDTTSAPDEPTEESASDPSDDEGMLFLTVSRSTVEFLNEFARRRGIDQRWAIDYIVSTYANWFGFYPPGIEFEE